MAESPVRHWTLADLETLPDDGGWTRYEIIDGELFTVHAPDDIHQIVTTRATNTLCNWNDELDRGYVMQGPGLIFADDDNCIPDIVWVSHGRYADIWRAADRKMHGGPELVVEVLSPGADNERRDREVKLTLYSRRGVDEYWLIDPAVRTVSVFRRTGDALALVAVLGQDDTLTSPVLPDFVVRVARFFPARYPR